MWRDNSVPYVDCGEQVELEKGWVCFGLIVYSGTNSNYNWISFLDPNLITSRQHDAYSFLNLYLRPKPK